MIRASVPRQISSDHGKQAPKRPKKAHCYPSSRRDGIDSAISGIMQSYTGDMAGLEQKLYSISVQVLEPKLQYSRIGVTDIRDGAFDDGIVLDHNLWTCTFSASSALPLKKINHIEVLLGGCSQISTYSTNECAVWIDRDDDAASTSHSNEPMQYLMLGFGHLCRQMCLKLRLVPTTKTQDLIDMVQSSIPEDEIPTISLSRGYKLFQDLTSWISGGEFVEEEVELVSISFRVRHVVDLLRFGSADTRGQDEEEIKNEIDFMLLCDRNYLRYKRRLARTMLNSRAVRHSKHTASTSKGRRNARKSS